MTTLIKKILLLPATCLIPLLTGCNNCPSTTIVEDIIDPAIYTSCLLYTSRYAPLSTKWMAKVKRPNCPSRKELIKLFSVTIWSITSILSLISTPLLSLPLSLIHISFLNSFPVKTGKHIVFITVIDRNLANGLFHYKTRVVGINHNLCLLYTSSRYLAGSGHRPLTNIPHCCLP